MKNKLFLRLAMNNVKRRRKNILNIIVLSFSIIILVVTLSASNSVNEFMYEKLQTAVDFRTILTNTYNMDKTEMVDDLLNIQNITKVYPFISNNGASVKEVSGNKKYNELLLNGEVFLKPYISNVSPEVLVGEEMRENDQAVGIIPKYFTPQKGIDISIVSSGQYFINGEDLIGETMILQYKEYSEGGTQFQHYEFLVGGVYDATISMDSPNTIYLPFNEMLLINKSFQKIDDVHVYAVIVDQYDHLSNVMRDLDINGYPSQLKSQIQGGIPQFIIHMGFLLFFFISTVSLIIIIMNSLNSLRERAGEIAVMKAIGYNNSEIFKLFIIETGIVCILSIFISLIIAALMMFGANIYIDHYFNLYFNELKFSFSDFFSGVTFSFLMGAIILMMIGVVVYTKLIVIHPKIVLRN